MSVDLRRSRRIVGLVPAALAVLVGTAGTALRAASDDAVKKSDHKQYFEHYEGTRTCLECHRDEALAFFESQHYQWRGESPGIVNSEGKKLGKINTINDFCTNPGASWIGLTRNSRGEILSKGCSACHAGLGELPAPEPSAAQLENIDCLICHASGYNRDLYPTEDGGWQWRPVLWKNQVGLDSVAKRIGLPERKMCLRCHAGSGGGPNYKRGDIEYALADAGPELDVHMAKDAAGLECTSCHAGEDHRVKGRGTDLSGTDSPDARLTCDGCHSETPHAIAALDSHTDRVYCTSCHVPSFARVDPTDMSRDWSMPVYDEEKDKYGPTIVLAKDVAPVYAWFDGTTVAQLPGEPARAGADGAVGMMLPHGSIDDPAAKIYAFKLHRGKLPILRDRRWIVPIVVEEFFADGDIDKAVRDAAREFYGVENAPYDWIETVRYMGLFHEVPPAERALGCLDCHRPGGRMDWRALGYAGDPLAPRPKQPE
jgi:hypothetical protein